MWEGLIELKYTGGFDRAQVYRRGGLKYLMEAQVWEGLIELKYTGGFDRAQVYGRV